MAKRKVADLLVEVLAEAGKFTGFPATRSTASRTEPKNFWDGSVVTVLIKRQILLGKLEVSHGTKRSGSNVGNA